MIEPDPSATRRVVFQYFVPVHVEVEDGLVVCVTVIDERGLAYQRDGQDHRIDADTVVVAAGYSPNDDLYRELAGRVDVSLIGDAANPDSILAAVHQGFHVARSL